MEPSASAAPSSSEAPSASDEPSASDAPPTSKPKYGNLAFDTRGNSYDIAELRAKRNVAVTKGMNYLHRFFKKNNFAALHEIGDDAPSIFFECWYTSSNSAIRMHARSICKQLMPVYEERLLQLTAPSPPPTPPLAAAAPARLGPLKVMPARRRSLKLKGAASAVRVAVAPPRP